MTESGATMGSLNGLVAIVTGAGSGLGRAHAVLLALEGAAVVANDLRLPEETIDEISAAGGTAVAHVGDVSDWARGSELVETAVNTFGRLDVLINNAGRGRVVGEPYIPSPLFAEMTEASWDGFLRDNLTTVVSPTRAAVGYWMSEAAAGRALQASVVNTISGAGLFGMPGQSAYGSAKAGVAALTLVCAAELTSKGIRFNAIAPVARTAPAASSPVTAVMAPPQDPREFDHWDPANVSPLVAFLASPACTFSGEVFYVWGSMIGHVQGWSLPVVLEGDGRWTAAELGLQLPEIVARASERPDPHGAFAALRTTLDNAIFASSEVESEDSRS
jgi:NAD(P)-dependent dehydrogenase (short-subunit alcohol dehydrogenase family)